MCGTDVCKSLITIVHDERRLEDNEAPNTASDADIIYNNYQSNKQPSFASFKYH